MIDSFAPRLRPRKLAGRVKFYSPGHVFAAHSVPCALSLEHNLGSEVLLLVGVVAHAYLQHPLGLHHLYVLHVFMLLLEEVVA